MLGIELRLVVSRFQRCDLLAVAVAREERRAQMLAATPGELRSLSADVTRIAAESPTCVFGGRDVIAKSNAGFNVIDLLG